MASGSTAHGQSVGDVTVAKFRNILSRGPYAPNMRGVSKKHVVGIERTPNARVIPLSWKCGQNDKHGNECGKENKISRVKCSRCDGGITDHRNVKNDSQGRPIQAGDDLNMVSRRLVAKYWECSICRHLQKIRAETIVTSYCDRCLDNDQLSEVEFRTWVWNEYHERLGTWDGLRIIELAPWMDNLWAATSRQQKGLPCTVIE